MLIDIGLKVLKLVTMLTQTSILFLLKEVDTCHLIMLQAILL